jgi:hypothetical protein
LKKALVSPRLTYCAQYSNRYNSVVATITIWLVGEMSNTEGYIMKKSGSECSALRLGVLGLAWCLAVAIMAAAPVSANGELTHRYSFKDGTANDAVGKVNGKLMGGAKIADSKLVLENTAKTSEDSSLSYLNFQDRILPTSGSATIEVWFTSNSDGGYARVFDFGQRGQGYLFLTVNDGGNGVARSAITATDFGEETTVSTEDASSGLGVNDGKQHMAAVVVDGAGSKFHLFIDGKEIGSPEPLNDNSLEAIKGPNHWIGRSQFDADAGFTGSINELRVFDSALTAEQIKSDYKAGAAEVGASAPNK